MVFEPGAATTEANFTEPNMTQTSELIDRITINPDIFGGKPIVRGMRIAVEHVLGKLAAGDSPETILKEYPNLESEDIQACLVFAHRSLSGEHVFDRRRVQKPS